jgi:hypothetical protein
MEFQKRRAAVVSPVVPHMPPFSQPGSAVTVSNVVFSIHPIRRYGMPSPSASGGSHTILSHKGDKIDNLQLSGYSNA